MHLRLISILCLLALSSALSSAEGQIRRRRGTNIRKSGRAKIDNPQFIDLHIFNLHPPEPGELPRIESLASRRYGPFVKDSRQMEMRASARVNDGIPGLRRLRVGPEYNNTVSVSYRYRSSNLRMSGTTHHKAGDVMTLGYLAEGPSLRIAIQATPHGEDPGELRLWSPEDLAEWMGQRVLSEPAEKVQGLLSTFINLPMQRLLPPPMVVELRDRIASPDWKPKPPNDGYSSRQLSSGQTRTAALVALGDPEATTSPFSHMWDQPPLRQVLMTAYAQSESPEQRGHIGWFLTRPYGGQHKRPMMAAFVEPFYRDIESGKAVLAGPSLEIDQRTKYLKRLAEEKQILLPLLVLLGAAIALFAICRLTRRIAHLGA